MSYQALYRKYRPSNLENVIGQDIVLQILKNSLKNDKIGHAYIFSGPRGTGKTSIAKLLAKIVNCEKPENGDCCGKCKNCISIMNGYSPDIIEIDAASNNGVDEIREIRNKVNLVPSELKYKVYIIDEVHMLSIGAFNALLKTLEEPPEHIIFILATTDLHKVPITIISRCQCFEFHRISENDIVERLEYICDIEKITVEKEILKNIAKLSYGGLRDAIGLLDKMNAYSNGNITKEDFEKVNGIISYEDKINFIDYVKNKDIKKIINFIDDQYNKGKDLILFINDILDVLKKKCISYYVENDNSYDINFLLEFSNMLNNLNKSINLSNDVKTLFEINILSFINLKNNNSEVINTIVEKPTEEIKKNKDITNDNNSQLNKIISREIINDEEKFKKINSQIINNSFAHANKDEKKKFEQEWKKLNNYALDSEYGAVASYLTDGVVRVVGESEAIISFNYESMVNRGSALIFKIEELIEKVFNKHYDIALLTNDEWNLEKEKFINNKNNNISYEYVKVDRKNNNENKSLNLDNDSITSQAIEMFGGDIISVN